MFVQDSSRELNIYNVSHSFTHLRKFLPPKKVLIINSYNKQLSNFLQTFDSDRPQSEFYLQNKIKDIYLYITLFSKYLQAGLHV